MAKYVYEFWRLGTLWRKNGVTMTDYYGNYISGEPFPVWWWPINWIAILIYLPRATFTIARGMWRNRRG